MVFSYDYVKPNLAYIFKLTFNLIKFRSKFPSWNILEVRFEQTNFLSEVIFLQC
jgi:hypothetical protein